MLFLSRHSAGTGGVIIRRSLIRLITPTTTIDMAGKGMNVKPVHTQRKWGPDILRDPNFNKGTAFTLKERQSLGIHGLLPPVVSTQEDQIRRNLIIYSRQTTDLDRYMCLAHLQDRNEKLFYKVLGDHLEMMMPIVYTPTVGLACQKYGHIFSRSRGIFITIHDKGHINELLCSWPEPDIKAIVVTDGERILGLGDLGCNGMGIPVGKLALYTACASVHPRNCLPVMIDVGTNNVELMNDPFYIGLRQKRDQSQAYDELLDEFMEAVVARYGKNCLVQFEDFGNHNAFRLLDKYKDRYCTFNDDIQGTASVAVAGLLASLKMTSKKLSDHTILFQGAGEAALGIAELIVEALKEETDGKMTEAEARQRIWLCDSKGLICKNRPVGRLTKHKELYAHEHEYIPNLGDIVKAVKPTIIIGVAAVKGAFTEQILSDMAAFNEKPIIFALSNPTSKAECTAEEAYKFTDGRCVFASGSPFDPVVMPDGRKFYPGQGNNAYIFPGVALAVIVCGIRHIDDKVFLEAAKALANLVSDEDLAQGRLYPPLATIKEISLQIAAHVCRYAYHTNMASHYPEPKDMLEFVAAQMYKTDYDDFLPDLYDWPPQAGSQN